MKVVPGSQAEMLIFHFFGAERKSNDFFCKHDTVCFCVRQLLTAFVLILLGRWMSCDGGRATLLFRSRCVACRAKRVNGKRLWRAFPAAGTASDAKGTTTKPTSSPASCVRMSNVPTRTAPAASPFPSSSWNGTRRGPLCRCLSPSWVSWPPVLWWWPSCATTTRPSCGRPAGRWATCCSRAFFCATPSPSWWSPRQV